jgi:hypothetical protein
MAMNSTGTTSGGTNQDDMVQSLILSGVPRATVAGVVDGAARAPGQIY